MSLSSANLRYKDYSYAASNNKCEPTELPVEATEPETPENSATLPQTERNPEGYFGQTETN